ncbi:hypothetical protein MTZ49_10855 [Entomomonas sp. E2T0]|uniref:hypothetical protein n=1 Tax=Entomomonas sp. E2T0 TaxID=2930213 RepID=UPI00222843EA|nr:hypothetical protein [Entomomonas sp. E2T0]UYZ83100.1 hypothetical protein MTZ49_10855 [Entomomonas sp. E2T0]
MEKSKKPLTPAERMKAKRVRDKRLHQKIGGKEKRIHIFNYTVQHIDVLMQQGKYTDEDEAIIDGLAVAAMLIQSNTHNFNELLIKARQLK